MFNGLVVEVSKSYLAFQLANKQTDEEEKWVRGAVHENTFLATSVFRFLVCYMDLCTKDL
jgi:hypothetical protein